MNFPSADLEIKIVLPVPFGGSLLSACCRRAGILLCKALKWLQGDNQVAHQEINLNAFITASFDSTVYPVFSAKSVETQGHTFDVAARFRPRSTDQSRVSVATKFGSQVRPPSFENACSKWCEVGVMSDQTCRTRTDRP